MDYPVLNQGNKLILPELSDVQEIIICNSIGETVSAIKYHREYSLDLLPCGFYWVYAVDKEREKKRIGTILKQGTSGNNF